MGTTGEREHDGAEGKAAADSLETHQNQVPAHHRRQRAMAQMKMLMGNLFEALPRAERHQKGLDDDIDGGGARGRDGRRLR